MNKQLQTKEQQHHHDVVGIVDGNAFPPEKPHMSFDNAVTWGVQVASIISLPSLQPLVYKPSVVD